MTRGAILVPGYRGTARQPILRAIRDALAAFDIAARAVELPTRLSRPSRGYEVEITEIAAARAQLARECGGQVALVGRSFGGRMCALAAERDPPPALVIVGHPIAPPGRARPGDERALAAVRCPTLVVQGDHDELGPLAVLERIAAGNSLIELAVLPGATHSLTSMKEREAAAIVAKWLAARL